MALQGLDRQVAPAAELGKRMLDHIGGGWWNVYIGGPEAGPGWTPDVVRDYVRHGIDRFMLTYVGRQRHGPLTAAQGKADAIDALKLAENFGYSGNFPLCLDVELSTYESARTKTITYVKAWCSTVKSAGARPGVYANPAPIKAMADGKVPADFVWVASWTDHGPAPHDPHAIPQVPHELWSKPGQRAWQYAGEFGNQKCQVLAQDVDINVADEGCLARAPGGGGGGQRRRRTVSAGTRLVRRGSRGKAVQQLTRRLSFVPSKATGRPYLDGPRGSLGPEAEAALKAFQSEHRLDADGVYGPDTAVAMARAIHLERARRQARQKGKAKDPKEVTPVAHTNGKSRKPAATLRGLIAEVRRLDAETDQAWQRLAAYGGARRRLVEKTGAGRDPGIAEITTILQRMQQTLESLVDLEEREFALEHPAVTQAAIETATTAQTAAAGSATYTTTIGAGGNGAGEPSALGTTPKAPVRLDQLTDEQLQERVDKLDRAIARSRMVLMRRYVEAEKALGVLAPRREPHTPTTPATPTTPKGTKPKVRTEKKPKETRRRRSGPRPAENIKEIQNALNRFSGKYLENVTPLIVDGVEGPSTKKRIRRVKYYLGYRGAEQRSTDVPPEVIRYMEHPRSPRNANPAKLARATARRRKQHKLAAQTSATSAGVATFDNKPVAAWLKPYLDWARAHGWQGQLNSGYRTPEYSEHLCYGICGAPSCSGTCAGRSSHHSIRVKPGGSIDVTDYVKFGELMRQCPYSPRIFNNLPNDRVHYSSTGN